MFKWQYLIDAPEDRALELYRALRPHLIMDDLVMDVNCGFSPLAKYLLEDGMRIKGIDVFHGAIEHLRRNHPEGEWVESPIESFYGKGLGEMDVLLLLGVCEPHETPAFQAFVRRVISESKPRVVMVECWLEDARRPAEGTLTIEPTKPWMSAFNHHVNALLRSGYEAATSKIYDSGNPVTRTRFYVIAEKPFRGVSEK